MSLLNALGETAKIASDYINGGMDQDSAYQAARNARAREAERKSQGPSKKAETKSSIAASTNISDAEPRTSGDTELA
jgi:hypothetical protein